MKELTTEELRAALAAADRGFRLPLLPVLIGTGLTVVAAVLGLKVLDLSDPTHVLILCAAVFLWAQGYFTVGLITTHQNAANARMLRALEMIDERLAHR